MHNAALIHAATSTLCPACGAPLPAGGSCRDTFAALLALEAGVPDAPGSVLHFYAVACYNLQHPDTMRLTQDALHGLAANLAAVLAGRATLAAIRQRTRRQANGAVRVLRRAGDPPPNWPRGSWPMHIADVYAGGVDRYADLVTAWAHAVSTRLQD
jgi:hypothetical protein